MSKDRVISAACFLREDGSIFIQVYSETSVLLVLDGPVLQCHIEDPDEMIGQKVIEAKKYFRLNAPYDKNINKRGPEESPMLYATGFKNWKKLESSCCTLSVRFSESEVCVVPYRFSKKYYEVLEDYAIKIPSTKVTTETLGAAVRSAFTICQ